MCIVASKEYIFSGSYNGEIKVLLQTSNLPLKILKLYCLFFSKFTVLILELIQTLKQYFVLRNGPKI